MELLSEPQRLKLLQHARVRLLPPRTIVYAAGAPAEFVFIIGDGAVKSFQELPSGKRRIVAFFFARDLSGLAEGGRYVNTVQTITPTQLYEIDVHGLTELFRRDAELELGFLCKAVHVIREAQHHNIIVARRDAAGRLAMLLRLLHRQSADTHQRTDVLIPMTRSDIANYLGLSLEAVGRACRRLEAQGIVEFTGRHQARIVDRPRFDALVSRL